jgi:hypothetical protein
MTRSLLGVLAAVTLCGACGRTTVRTDGSGGSGGGWMSGAAGGSAGAAGRGGAAGQGSAEVDSGRASDAADASIDGAPSVCAEIRPLVLSDPTVVSGTVAGGQTVTVRITLTDTDPNGYLSYPEAFLTSPTSGVSFLPDQAGPPGAYIDGSMAKSIMFSLKLDATIAAGTVVQIDARPVGSGHLADDCHASVLSFSLTAT